MLESGATCSDLDLKQTLGFVENSPVGVLTSPGHNDDNRAVTQALQGGPGVMVRVQSRENWGHRAGPGRVVTRAPSGRV